MQKPYALVGIALTIIFTLAHPAFSENRTKALILWQWEEIAGDHEVTACSDALKVFSKKSKTTLIAKAPDWKVYFFNAKSKVILETECAKWHSPFGIIVGMVASNRFQGGVGAYLGQAKVAGLPARRFAVIAQSEKISGGRVSYEPKKAKAVYYISDTKPKFPKELCSILQKSFGMPQADGLALKMDIADNSGKVLLTHEAHFATVDKNIFAVPTNFRKVRNDSEVLFSDNQGLMDDFADSVDDTRNLYHAPKHK